VAAILLVPGVAKAQIVGIAFTVVLAFVAGGVGGVLIRATGQKHDAYEDGEDFAGAPSTPEPAQRDHHEAPEPQAAE
jgi:hypothetical protein